MARIALALLAVLAGLIAPAAAGAAAGPLTIGDWRPVSGAELRLLTDGERYVVSRSERHAVRALDTTTNRARRLTPPPCDDGPSMPAALGSGMLVWNCRSLVALGGHTIVVDDLATGRRFLPAAFPRFRALESPSHDGSTFYPVSVGRHWIYLTRLGRHSSDDVLVALTGEQIAHAPPYASDRTVDPDRATGTRRLCAAIRRPEGVTDVGTLPFVNYHSPYALVDDRLRRCAGAPAVPRGPIVAALSDDYLSWATGRLLRVRSTGARRTVRRTAPGTVRVIALTKRYVYVTTGRRFDRTYRAVLR